MAVNGYFMQPASVFSANPAGIPVYYVADTAAELPASNEGDFGYAIDTKLSYQRTNAAWIALEKRASKGAASGYADLDASTLVPVAQIPSLAALGAQATSAKDAANGYMGLDANTRPAYAKGVPVLLDYGRKNSTASGAGFVNLYRLSIPANLLGTTRGIIGRISVRMSTGTTTASVFRMRYGTTTIGTSITPANLMHIIDFTLVADGATNVQRGIIQNGGFKTEGAAAEDSTGALNLDIDVDLFNDADVFTCFHAKVELA